MCEGACVLQCCKKMQGAHKYYGCGPCATSPVSYGLFFVATPDGRKKRPLERLLRMEADMAGMLHVLFFCGALLLAPSRRDGCGQR